MPTIDVFLSYHSGDRETAEFLAEAFERQSWTVWWDRRVVPGEYYDVAIEDALDASTVAVLLWSKTSAASNWVRAEAEDAASRNILLPVRLDETKLPLRLRRIQTVNLTDWQPEVAHDGFQLLLKTMAARLGKPVLHFGPLPSAEGYVDEGNQHERQGHPIRAAAAYIQALKSDPDNTLAETKLLALIGSNPKTPAERSESNVELGRVSWFNPEKGFGFVTPEVHDLPVFVHISAVERAGYHTLVAGQRIAYITMSASGRTSVFKLRVLDL
jgi:cold shock CspA family protein